MIDSTIQKSILSNLLTSGANALLYIHSHAERLKQAKGNIRTFGFIPNEIEHAPLSYIADDLAIIFAEVAFCTNEFKGPGMEGLAEDLAQDIQDRVAVKVQKWTPETRKRFLGRREVIHPSLGIAQTIIHTFGAVARHVSIEFVAENGAQDRYYLSAQKPEVFAGDGFFNPPAPEDFFDPYEITMRLTRVWFSELIYPTEPNRDRIIEKTANKAISSLVIRPEDGGQGTLQAKARESGFILHRLRPHFAWRIAP